MRGKGLRGILEACYFKEGETLKISILKGRIGIPGFLEACYFKEGETLVIQGPFFAFVYITTYVC